VKDNRSELGKENPRRKAARREIAPEIERHLGSVLPDAQARGDDRREAGNRPEQPERRSN